MLRLSPQAFKIPISKIRKGFYSDRYFLRTQQILISDQLKTEVGYQFFPREDAFVCGLDEAVAILKMCAGFFERGKWKDGWPRMKVYALPEGRWVKNNQTILAVVGDPRCFVHLETPLLGVIARATSVATSVARVVKAARNKKILFFSSRFDHYRVQDIDGYVALKAGVYGVSTVANGSLCRLPGTGTMPHFLIGCFAGDTAKATLAFDRIIEPKVLRIALVDWDNDCIGTTRKVLTALVTQKISSSKKITPSLFNQYAPQVVGEGKGRLWGVRFDTAARLRDRSVKSHRPNAYGVCPELVKRARKEFDRWGCRNLKIVVSGGFDEEKIARFERLRTPVDAYGVGSSLLRHKIDITADIVEYKGKPCAKVGRRKGDWLRLRRVQ